MLAVCAGMVFHSLSAQEFTHINFPDHLCAGTVDTITFGYNSTNDISLVQLHATLSQAGRVFLPDGVSCGSMGCSYRSTVTFTDFSPTAHITSVQDIKYVRLKIEHSYVGDIYIGITCPGQQSVSLMNWSGTGSSNCDAHVPSGRRSWNSGSNMSLTNYLGQAYDFESYWDDCDSTDTRNAPGTGWNYCWSNNTTSGYTYASGDGLIYRSGNAHGGKVDSSNVAAGTHFYHPNQSFSGLIGCPLNGQWYIEVIDAYSGDNGWIFGWELALDPALLPADCDLVSRDILGDGMTKLNDSTYTLSVPADLTTDSLMYFTLRMLNSCGDTIDSVVSVNVHPNLSGDRNDTVCDSYAWQGGTLTDDSTLFTHLQTAYGCDSLLAIHLTVLHSTADTVSMAVVENALPYSFMGIAFGRAVTDTTIHTTNAVGCDSAVLFTLSVWENVSSLADSTVCAHQLPVIWNNVLFDSACSQSAVLTAASGADSVVVMALKVDRDDTVYVYDTVVENSLPYWCAGRDFAMPVQDEVTHLTNQFGCDSAVHLYLHVWYNERTDVDTAVCIRKVPVYWGGASFADTHSVVLHNIHGADSTVTMHVSIIPNDTTDIFDTVVENMLPYTFQGRWTFVSDADTNMGLVSTDNCDSILHYRLKVWRNVNERYSRQICTSQLPYEWNGETFYEAGTVVQHLYTSHGADSTVTLIVVMYPDYDTTVDAAICDNQSYTLGPLTLTEAGQYEHLFASIHGCDSMVHVNLAVWPTFHTQIYDTVCATSGITFDGVHYTSSGSYTKKLYTEHQCDSLVTLNLTLKGLYLKARAHISPTIVTPEDLAIEMEDISRASCDRLWLIGDEEYRTTKVSYTYPAEEDTVPLLLIAYSEDGCADTLHRLLQIDRTTIFAPNAFTPNLETNNQWFIVSRDIEYMEVWIYNRQGNLVHHYTGADGYWDGTHDGKPCRQDVYVYRCEYRSRVYKDRQQSLTGTIMLIR